MLGQILTQITQSDRQKITIIERLTLQNEDIMAQVQRIESDLNNVLLKDIEEYVEGPSSSNSLNISKSGSIEQKLAKVQQFHILYSTAQKESKRCDYLLEQIKVITQLAHHYDLFGTLQLHEEPSSQANLKYFKQLSEIISQQILQYQNQQNTNRFESQHEEVCQQYSNVIQFYKTFKSLVIFLYQSSIKSNFQFNQNAFKINKQYFAAVWKQDSRFYQNFLELLAKYFQKFITYDINDRQYTLSSYALRSNSDQLQVLKTSKLVFDSNEVSLHYDVLISSLSTLHTFFNEFQAITPQNYLNSASSVKKDILDQIKSYVQYLLPYLTMQLRRKLLSHLSIKPSVQSLNIYELLVSLRMCGKDADMLVKSIKHIFDKVHEDPNTLPIIVKFIEIAKQNKKNHHMNFFVCNQLIQELEQGEISTQISDAIKRLLIIREQMRMKIHNIDVKQ